MILSPWLSFCHWTWCTYHKAHAREISLAISYCITCTYRIVCFHFL